MVPRQVLLGFITLKILFLVQKNRLIQACPIQVKDKSVQTSTDDNVLKQLEQKDKRISELEKSQLKAKKQIDKNSKLEKEISELRAINLRQSKELESVKSMKKKHKVITTHTSKFGQNFLSSRSSFKGGALGSKNP